MVNLWNTITLTLKFCTFGSVSSAFVPLTHNSHSASAFISLPPHLVYKNAFELDGGISKPLGVHKGDGDGLGAEGTLVKKLATFSLAISIVLGSGMSAAVADTAASSVAKYDGFADYAKENQMEKSDVACFANKCGDQTKALFANPRGIKGVSWYVNFFQLCEQTLEIRSSKCLLILFSFSVVV